MTSGTHTTTRGLPELVYSGHIIHDRHELLSLTDMWRAAGSPEDRRPAEWLRSADAQRFIDALGVMSDVGNSHTALVETKKGGPRQGTWAHWQVALAYAKYLSPEFHMWCNTVVRERMEGHAVGVPAELVELIERTDGICRMMIGKVAGIEKALPILVAQIATEVLPSMVSAAMASQTFAVRRGKTAGQIWRDHGFPRVRITGWFGNRLAAMGCAIEGGGRGELGLTTARLFDPDKADAWLRNGGRMMVERKIAERKGQGALRLVGGHAAA